MQATKLTHVSLILQNILYINADPVPPPDRISASVSFDHPGGITFTWDEVDSSCDIVHYRVITSNCGVCSATNITTLYTRVLCTNLTTDGSICSFAVQTIVCNDVAGNVSEPIHVLLRGMCL